jgi:putative ABC transport system permease protein
MDTLIQDLRFGIRMLLQKPGFTIVALIALALGIGANTAIFSVVNTILIRPLPYTESDKLVWIWEENPASDIKREPASGPNFTDWKNQNSVFENMTGFTKYNPILTESGEPERITGTIVSSSFFDVLKAQAAMGRTFLPEEDQKGKDKVVVLSQGLWQRRFGADPKILGNSIKLNGNSFTVVGIMPPSFENPLPGEQTKAELWVPIGFDLTKMGRRGDFLNVIGRLKPGISIEQARAELKTIAGRLEQQYQSTNAGWSVTVLSLHERFVGDVKPALIVILGAVGFLLLIACANVANLLLSRATARQKEIAIRNALGAGRSRIIRQLLTESLILSIAGGAIGLLLALWGVEALVAFSPGNIPRIDKVTLDNRVLGFTLGISFLTGVLFGLIPALHASRSDLNEALKEGGRSSTEGIKRNKIRNMLVVSEIALALVLLIGSGLMVKSFLKLQQVNPGFNPDNLLTMQFTLPRSKYKETHQLQAFYQQLIEKVKSVPGIQNAAVVGTVPLSGGGDVLSFNIEGRPLPPLDKGLDSESQVISSEYFSTMGIKLLKGRYFTEQDTKDSQKVAIINEAMAKRYWPGEDPIGKRITQDDPLNTTNWLSIVGIVEDVKHNTLDEVTYPQMYEIYTQRVKPNLCLVAKTTGDPLNLASAIRGEVQSLDKDQPLYNVKSMESLLSSSIAGHRFNTFLIGIFAAIALILTAVGIYGVISYSVNQRTNEIGIRMALGAQQNDVFKLIVGQGLKLALLGVAIGLAGAFTLTRVLYSLLFGVSTTDLITFTVVPIIIVAVALIASFIPARRATKVDPTIALRYE